MPYGSMQQALLPNLYLKCKSSEAFDLLLKIYFTFFMLLIFLQRAIAMPKICLFSKILVTQKLIRGIETL